MVQRWFRFGLTVFLIAAIFIGVYLYITYSNLQRAVEVYRGNIEVGVQTAVWDALFDATRTAEAPLPHYIVIKLGTDELLADVAHKYHTTVEVLQMANGLLPTVQSGSGVDLIVPVGVQELVPARRFHTVVGLAGDTLTVIANREKLPLEILEDDNPILAQRGISPGDIIFVAKLI